MPFWSRGNEESDSGAKDFSDDSAFQEHVPMSSPSGAGGAGGGMAELQQFAAQMQQQAIIQKTITILSDKAFEACITKKPSDSLSGREAACMQAVTMKWLDTNQFMVGRLQKKMSAGQESSYS